MNTIHTLSTINAKCLKQKDRRAPRQERPPATDARIYAAAISLVRPAAETSSVNLDIHEIRLDRLNCDG